MINKIIEFFQSGIVENIELVEQLIISQNLQDFFTNSIIFSFTVIILST